MHESITSQPTILRILFFMGVFLLLADSTRAWDEVTHAYITEMVIEEIRIPELQQLLEKNKAEFLSGCWFTDSYQYTENRIDALNPHHLDAYANAYLNYLELPEIRQQENYEKLVALFFGSIAHTTEDFWLDNILYQYPRTIGEDLSGDVYNGVVTINKFNYLDKKVIPYFPANDLFAMYTNAGMLESAFDTQEKFEKVFGRLINKQYEQLRLLKLLSFLASKQVQNEIPWMSANIKTAPGGMLSCAKNTARYMEALWMNLHGQKSASVLNTEFSPLDNRLGLLLSLPHSLPESDQLEILVQNDKQETLTGSIKAYSFGGTRSNLVNLVYLFDNNQKMDAGFYSVSISLLNSEMDPFSSHFEVPGIDPANYTTQQPHPFFATLGAGIFLFILCLGIGGLFWGVSGVDPFIRAVKQPTPIALPLWSRIMQTGLQGLGIMVWGLGIYILLTRGWLVVLNV